MSRAVVGRYDLALTTLPAGATLRVDGEAVAGRTPLTIPLEPGEHRVELTFGEYANAVFTVDGRARRDGREVGRLDGLARHRQRGHRGEAARLVRRQAVGRGPAVAGRRARGRPSPVVPGRRAALVGGGGQDQGRASPPA